MDQTTAYLQAEMIASSSINPDNLEHWIIVIL